MTELPVMQPINMVRYESFVIVLSGNPCFLV